MKKGIIAAGIWCVDFSYKIKNWPSEGKTSIIEKKIDGAGGGPSNVLTNLEYLGFKYPKIALGCIGKDKEAEIIKKHNKKNNIISNVTASLIDDKSQIKDLLIKQICGRVRWRESINLMSSSGVKNILELGPGKTLTNMMKRFKNDIKTLNIENFEDIKSYD